MLCLTKGRKSGLIGRRVYIKGSTSIRGAIVQQKSNTPSILSCVIQKRIGPNKKTCPGLQIMIQGFNNAEGRLHRYPNDPDLRR